VLYGARDSFIEHYHGNLPAIELEPERVFSGTAERKRLVRGATKASKDFRAGAVWASGSRWPQAIPTVDVAILSEDGQRILLARKPKEDLYRFVGGFAAPESESYEDDATREVMEETGLRITPPQYVGSKTIDDWRYRSEVDKVRTLLFKAKVLSGSPKADDDIEEVRWFDLYALDYSDLVPEHVPLMDMLWENIKRNGDNDA
jgi:bifunctional NMN adenylyltransferase/nudix hydrolase